MSSDFETWLSRNNTTTAANGLHFGETFDDLYTNNIYLTFVGIFSILIVVSNGIVVMVVAYCRDLHLPTLWNIAFMAICDLVYGLHYLMFSIPSLYIGKFAYSDNIIRPASITYTLLTGQNVFNIFMSIVDRYIAVCWPMRYPGLMSTRRFLIAVLSLVTINIIRLCLIIFPNSVVYYNKALGVCLVDFNTTMAASASVGLPSITSLLITVLLIKIWMEFQYKKRVHPTASNSPSNKFTVTICLAAVVFFICYIPSCGSIVMNLIYGKTNISTAYLQSSVLIMLSNSFWNVVIYATTYRPFRNGFLKLFCRKIFRDEVRREGHFRSWIDEEERILMDEPSTSTLFLV